MTENELSKNIVDLYLKIHKTLGPGLLESVYEAALVYELKNLVSMSRNRSKSL
jgi:GxxExxY protein